MTWYAVKHAKEGYVILARREPFTMRVDDVKVEAKLVRPDDAALVAWLARQQEPETPPLNEVEQLKARVDTLTAELEALKTA